MFEWRKVEPLTIFRTAAEALVCLIVAVRHFTTSSSVYQHVSVIVNANGGVEPGDEC